MFEWLFGPPKKKPEVGEIWTMKNSPKWAGDKGVQLIIVDVQNGLIRTSFTIGDHVDDRTIVTETPTFINIYEYKEAETKDRNE